MKNSNEEFYKRLKDELEKTTQVWPTKYMYKFILPDDEQKKETLRAVFSDKKATISTKDSKKGKYVAFSIQIEMPSADAIIDLYKQATKIEGIISL